MKQFKSLLVLLGLVVLVACETSSPPLTGPLPPPEAKINRAVEESTQDGLTISFDPRVDILFVIDDSNSMRKHQEKLSKNIKSFVDELAKNDAIDFQIGFTTVHDSGRYGKTVPEVCGPETTTPGRRNWDPAGTLKPLKGLDAKLESGETRRYVTKKDDFRTILKNSLDPLQNTELVKSLIDLDPKNPTKCPYGAEAEESFSPVLGAIEDPSLEAGPNKGFRRPGAFFVAILVSDAKDAGVPMLYTEKAVADRIAKAVGKDSQGRNRFRVFAVAMKPETAVTQNCKPDPAFATEINSKGSYVYPRSIGKLDNPLANLAALTEDPDDGSGQRIQQVLSICDNDYGVELARYGGQIQKDTLRDVTVQLPSRWEVTEDPTKRVRVFLGDLELEEGSQWDRNPVNRTVTVYGNQIDWDRYPGEKIRVSYTPVNIQNKTSVPVN